MVLKLLIHVLIVFAPFMLFTIRNNKDKKLPRYYYAVLQGIAASICMLIPFYENGINWDLRYIPMVLAFLYGGKNAGYIVLLFIVVTRTFLNGEALIFGYISAILAAIIPYLLQNIGKKDELQQRIIANTLIGLWPALIQLFVLLAFLSISSTQDPKLSEILPYIFMFFLSYFVGTGFSVMIHEIYNERVLMKREIQRAEKQSAMGELAASIAHEVRNPLTVVKGFLQLMKEERKINDQYLSLVLSELDRAESIINDYLNYSKPQFSKDETVLLSTILNDILNILNPYALQRGVHLQSHLQSTHSIKADRNQFKQALVNIIKNGIEATPMDGKVTVQLTSKDNMALIIISDTGKGMTMEEISRIGTRFFTTKEKGTGLGTAVSHQIIEKMNGKIEYRSEIGKGTVVSISLPITLN